MPNFSLMSFCFKASGRCTPCIHILTVCVLHKHNSAISSINADLGALTTLGIALYTSANVWGLDSPQRSYFPFLLYFNMLLLLFLSIFVSL